MSIPPLNRDIDPYCISHAPSHALRLREGLNLKCVLCSRSAIAAVPDCMPAPPALAVACDTTAFAVGISTTALYGVDLCFPAPPLILDMDLPGEGHPLDNIPALDDLFKSKRLTPAGYLELLYNLEEP